MTLFFSIQKTQNLLTIPCTESVTVAKKPEKQHTTTVHCTAATVWD